MTWKPFEEGGQLANGDHSTAPSTRALHAGTDYAMSRSQHSAGWEHKRERHRPEWTVPLVCLALTGSRKTRAWIPSKSKVSNTSRCSMCGRCPHSSITCTSPRGRRSCTLGRDSARGMTASCSGQWANGPVRAAGDGDPGCSINHDRGGYSKRPAIAERIMGPKTGGNCGTRNALTGNLSILGSE